MQAYIEFRTSVQKDTTSRQKDSEVFFTECALLNWKCSKTHFLHRISQVKL